LGSEISKISILSELTEIILSFTMSNLATGIFRRAGIKYTYTYIYQIRRTDITSIKDIAQGHSSNYEDM